MTPKSLLAPARLAGVPLLRSQTDERLVDLVRAGNDAAFEAIVARYRRPLLRHCGRMLSDERAEDVVQQAFVRALAAMRRDERPLDLKPWLYTIAHNAALNALRERSVPSASLEEEVDGVERPEQAYERREGLRSVIAAVGALPQNQRDAIVLRELEGRSYDEIARELGVTGGAVRQLLNRARTTLRAGVTAVTPVGLLLRVPLAADEPLTERVAELTVASAGIGTVAAKAAASAVVAGAVIGGIAAAPDSTGDPLPPPAQGVVAEAREEAVEIAEDDDAAGGGARSERRGRDARSSGEDGSGRRSDDSSGSDDDDRSGRRSGDDDGDDSDNSGPGSVDDGGSDSSGPGSGGDDGLDSSGPGSGGEDNSGPGSGEDQLADDNSGSGSSGSGSSGSDSGGSGSSGSGSSGSDDGDRSGSSSGPG
jgi:RNA polymerase sigma factor (sigma-70 family)